jgi:DNA-directed RNA polymerase specialized sigma24 family protein
MLKWMMTQMRSRKDEEREYECLNKCMENLSPQEREIVLTLGACGADDKVTKIRHRRELAAKLDITYNDLRVEVHRIRAKVKHCVSKCLSG